MLKVWMSHGDKVTALPPGFKLMASTPQLPHRRHGHAGPSATTRCSSTRGHAHACRATPCSTRFVLSIAGKGGDWVMRTTSKKAVAKIREQVGDEEVILGLSGGVDSSVAAALIHRAIGDQLTCVFVDHGLLRLNEGDMVMDMFAPFELKVVRWTPTSSWVSWPA